MWNEGCGAPGLTDQRHCGVGRQAVREGRTELVPQKQRPADDEHEDEREKEVREADVEGELALRVGWPSMFRGYLNQEERYRKCFSGDYYLTGD
ncbi:MAG: hypothetical protein WCI61_09820, partial [Chloroflexota bacterium]